MSKRSEKQSGNFGYKDERNKTEITRRFSIVKEKINMNENSKNISEVENEFRFFYPQNYSNTV